MTHDKLVSAALYLAKNYQDLDYDFPVNGGGIVRLAESYATSQVLAVLDRIETKNQDNYEITASQEVESEIDAIRATLQKGEA